MLSLFKNVCFGLYFFVFNLHLATFLFEVFYFAALLIQFSLILIQRSLILIQHSLNEFYLSVVKSLYINLVPFLHILHKIMGSWIIILSSSAHVIEIDLKGASNPVSGEAFHVYTKRYNPAAVGQVTGSITFASFWSSVLGK